MEDKEEFVFIHFEQPRSAFCAFGGGFEVAAGASAGLCFRQRQKRSQEEPERCSLQGRP